MDEIDIEGLVDVADSCFCNGIEHFKKRDMDRAFYALARSRAINLYLERAENVARCNDFFNYYKKEEILTEEEMKRWYCAGEGTMQFLVGLIEGGREFLEEEIRRQNR